MERLPYVGIACVTSMDQVERLAAMAGLLPEGRVLALGFQVSEKTLRGERNKYPHMFPAVADLRMLMSHWYPRVEYHVHFSPDEDYGLGAKLEQLAELAGSNLDGVQINFPWPSADELDQFLDRHFAVRIIQQVGKKMIGSDSSAAWLASEIQRQCAAFATDMLFDLSGGLGERVDVDRAHRFLRAIGQTVYPEVGLGVAGGLGPETIRLVKPLLAVLPDLSWDAQSSFFDEERQFVLERAKLYIERSAELLA